MNHTPGPYEIELIDDQEIRINAPNGDPDLECATWECLAVFYGSDDDPEIGHKKVLANARLFSAAPEMYESLRAMIEWYGDGVDIVIDIQAKAAIAKAEGVTE